MSRRSGRCIPTGSMRRPLRWPLAKSGRGLRACAQSLPARRPPVSSSLESSLTTVSSRRETWCRPGDTSATSRWRSTLAGASGSLGPALRVAGWSVSNAASASPRAISDATLNDARNRADALRAYYDEFSHRYEAERRPNRPDGYHALLDDLEVELVQRYGGGLDVLECGAGTGLLLQRIAAFARSAKGIDLSNGMLKKARERGLDVREATITAIPFADASFDVTCAFKVLAHVPEVGLALAEMSRVTRRGGVLVAQIYNPLAFGWLLKRLRPTRRLS